RAGGRLGNHLARDLAVDGQIGGDLQQVECPAGVAVGGLNQQLLGLGGQLQAVQTALGILQGLVDQHTEIVGRQRGQHIGAHPREQRVVELERGVFGGGADEDHGAVFNMRQESVLL